MDFKQAVAFNVIAHFPKQELTSHETLHFVDINEALKALAEVADSPNAPIHMHRSRRKHAGDKHVNSTIANIYTDLMYYWPEFGILDRCTLKQFASVVRSISTPTDDGIIVGHCMDLDEC